ncbi:MAG: hypothetical protein BWY74_03215 [Firmicutes bacterium ADurb.Bin419]|nr:MAG: hypothetical protein BWY74_03215 [Firmicutes bacterium ADurb.Bin419]
MEKKKVYTDKEKNNKKKSVGETKIGIVFKKKKNN